MEESTRAAKSDRPRHGVSLEPEVILPEQFNTGTTLDASSQPEQRLMLAVLEEAVGTFQKYCLANERSGQRLFVDAEDWFTSDDIEWPYSFVNICHTLDLEVDYVRDGMVRWQTEQQDAHARGTKVLRFPFRRVNGTRHSVTGRAPGLRQSA